ncbi:hypothetical protein DCAR_0729515 [Daucus carota subsp. sativus]|uniref:Zinc-finger domain-containing protein n=1 Tax=Daucus carota subsp. sativus TaxID=79200 RepID=A0A161ZQ85_DAUCS|nr:PREDICTED: uncharacterized protein LOC108193665 [Daucus carota subsp. sativus]WOH10054.1 hypothetical protein DCAR_0729515 [Daucus carota subsp. sativus]
MVTINNASTESPAAAPEQNVLQQSNERKMSEYERCREERIKENLERMKKLGILDLSLKLKASAKPKRRCNNGSGQKTPQRESPVSRHVGPVRRSSRLGSVTPISYSELPLSKKDSFETDEGLLRKGPRPEIYTEDQLKLLGCSNTSWTLFVDGYGKDGKRIYDQIHGKTCHQCRQKTLGYRTRCSQCCKVQGQFCGDCLYMRYGENVFEALQNPDWICPVCRGICNCSLCRNAKGWAPTGMMYKKVTRLGFKSVAHYLLHTATDSEKEGTKVPGSAKRSLAFSSTEATSINMESVVSKDNLKESAEKEFEKDMINENHKGDTNDQGSLMPKPKDNCQHDETNMDGHVDTETREGTVKMSANVEKNKEDGADKMNENHKGDAIDQGSSTPKPKDNCQHDETNMDGHVDTETREGTVEMSADVEKNKEDGADKMNENHKGDTIDQGSSTPRPKDNCQHDETNIDGHVDTETREDSVKMSADIEKNKEIEHCHSIIAKKNVTASKRKTPVRSEPMPDSIGARLRAAKISANAATNKEESVQNLENKHCESSVAKNTTASKRKTANSSEPMPDSIGARLRARRRLCSP